MGRAKAPGPLTTTGLRFLLRTFQGSDLSMQSDGTAVLQIDPSVAEMDISPSGAIQLYHVRRLGATGALQHRTAFCAGRCIGVATGR